MELVKKLENVISKWLKPIPNLPTNAQKWLADNVWWLVLISVILSVMGLIFSISALIAFWSFVPYDYYGYTTTLSPYGNGWLTSALLSVIFTIVIVAITASAISPLKLLRHRGWLLLFIVYLLSALEIVVNAVLTLNVFGFITTIISGAIGLAIGGYFLFQIRHYFGTGVRVVKTAASKRAASR